MKRRCTIAVPESTYKRKVTRCEKGAASNGFCSRHNSMLLAGRRLKVWVPEK